jgi:hypothetical protein
MARKVDGQGFLQVRAELICGRHGDIAGVAVTVRSRLRFRVAVLSTASDDIGAEQECLVGRLSRPSSWGSSKATFRALAALCQALAKETKIAMAVHHSRPLLSAALWRWVYDKLPSLGVQRAY